MEEKINTKDIYATFWRCRDFELANLWQRSIFLTAFLVLCFTAYGSIMVKIVDWYNKNPEVLLLLNTLAFCIAIVGMVFSILWIKMGKGSKAWYEKYENAIVAIETNTDYTTKNASLIGGFSFEKLEDYDKIKLDNSILSTKAGAYSVSRINISIGIVFLILWFCIALAHLFVVSFLLYYYLNSCFWGTISIILGIFVLLITLFLIGSQKMFSSSSLE